MIPMVDDGIKTDQYILLLIRGPQPTMMTSVNLWITDHGY